jgi:hypothetical protein
MPSFRQQPSILSFLQVCVAVSHVSAVHRLTSTQSPSAWQQSATAANAQLPALHESVVHGLLSLQSASAAQQPAFGATEHLF